MLVNPLADARNLALTFFALAMAAEANAGEPGKMTREVWSELPGPRLSTFAQDPRFKQPADAVSTITVPVADDCPFWIASDDGSELRPSTSDSKFHSLKIAALSGGA